MQATKYSKHDVENRPSPLRAWGMTIGYSLCLFGALSTLSIPLYISFLAILFGGTLVILASPKKAYAVPPMTFRSWIFVIAGMAVIFAVLAFFGDDQVRRWRPHPAGYIPAWWICFHVCRQFRYMLSSHVPETNNVT